MGAVVLEIFQGKQYGSIFGTIMLAALAGGAGRRRGRPVGDGADVRSFGQLHLGLCDRHCCQPPLGDRDLARVAGQGEGGRGADAQGAHE